MTLSELNKLSKTQALEVFRSCCGVNAWFEELERYRPFSSVEDLFQKAEVIWQELPLIEQRKVFHHHPRIGEKLKQVGSFSEQEQAQVSQSSDKTLKELAQANQDYEKKFGFIFLICATGKSAQEVLTNIQTRIKNDFEIELKTAMEEQLKINQIRLSKLLDL